MFFVEALQSAFGDWAMQALTEKLISQRGGARRAHQRPTGPRLPGSELTNRMSLSITSPL